MDAKALKEKAKRRGIAIDGEGGYSRHILLCIGSNCCSDKDGQDVKETLKYLNKRLKQLEKAGVHVYRTQVECLSFCRNGPLAVVYPEGTWYHSVTPEVCEQIIEKHLVRGEIVTEFAFAHNPLCALGKPTQPAKISSEASDAKTKQEKALPLNRLRSRAKLK